MHSEWELLVISEDIRLNDYIMVENEDGGEEKLKFVAIKGKTVVFLANARGDKFAFSALTLEEIRGYRLIRGKAA